MKKRLRFTGKNPPRSLWARYPNWQNALEEEGFPGQDETTLRPADNQQAIDEYTTFAAGNAILADGRVLPAFVNIVAGVPAYVSVYPDPKREVSWGVRLDASSKRWTAMNEPWYLVSDMTMPVPLDTPGIFPLKVSTRLPMENTGKPLSVRADIGKSKPPGRTRGSP